MLCESGNSLCEKFPKGAPLAERNSIDIGLTILFRPEYQSLREAIFPDELDKIEFGKTLFQSILITDIATPENVHQCIRRFEISQDESVLVSFDLCPLAHYLSDIFDGLRLAEDVTTRHPDEFVYTRNKLKSCARNEHLMLLSDIAHLLQGWANFVKWNFRLCEYEIRMLVFSYATSSSLIMFSGYPQSQTRNFTIVMRRACVDILDWGGIRVNLISLTNTSSHYLSVRSVFLEKISPTRL